MKKYRYALILLALLAFHSDAFAKKIEGDDDIELLESADVEELLEEKGKASAITDESLDLSNLEEVDDLESLKNDVSDIIFEDVKKKEEEKKVPEVKEVVKKEEKKSEKKELEIFDVGEEERELLKVSKLLIGKIEDKEWDEISLTAKVDRYVVQQDDWLWKISKRLFGTGFYYSKIWALNPYITNPHNIEPGMILVFSTGDDDSLPSVRLGQFEEYQGSKAAKAQKTTDMFNMARFGSGSTPTWLKEREKLIKQGVYFQYSSASTYDDLVEIGNQALTSEYRSYEPPKNDIMIKIPEQYDAAGFDKNSKIEFKYNEGYFLNSFITKNIVIDLGEIKAFADERIFVGKFNKIYVKFDSSARVKPGDLYSIYSADGRVVNKASDRNGYQYTITAQIEVLRRVNHLWECKVIEQSGIVRRGDRITTYTAKINQITKTFSKRNIEAIVMKSYRDSNSGLSFGDVIFLDRGRADGVELGTIFSLYSFMDRGTDKPITPDPTYKIGELTVISLTDDFSTALITNSSSEIEVGTLAISKTEEEAALASRVKNNYVLKDMKKVEADALDELDVELNLDDISDDLLDRADSVELTEDELEELERQEREKSIIKDHEADLKELDRLESEIVEAEAQLNEVKVDEDKFLEQQNLDNIEKNGKKKDPNAFESLDDIEKDIGRKYMDQDLNARENPYGLTEFDLEEIDELLNTDSK